MLKFIATILFAQVLVAAPVPADLTNGGSLVKRNEFKQAVGKVLDAIDPFSACGGHNRGCPQSPEDYLYDTHQELNPDRG